MPNLKISEFPAGTPISTDVIPYVDGVTGVTKKAPKSILQGTDGKTLLNGTITPTTEGVDGDFYINTVTLQIFGPKDAGVWGVGTSISITWLDEYNGGTGYIINDAISYNGSSYLCILASTGNLPTNATYWAVLAEKGTDGAGDMTGPASSTDNAIARYDSTTGKLLQNSSSTINDNGSINIPTGEEYRVNGTDIKDTTETLTNKTFTSPVVNVTSDATGDIYYRNASGLFTRLPIGTTGQVLTEASGIPSWTDAAGGGSKATVDAYRITSLNISAFTETQIIHEIEIIDTGGDYNTGTGTFTAPRDGNYLVMATMQYRSGSTVSLRIKKNTTILVDARVSYTGNDRRMVATRIIPMSASDTIKIFGYNDGGTVNVQVGANDTFLSIQEL